MSFRLLEDGDGPVPVGALYPIPEALDPPPGERARRRRWKIVHSQFGAINKSRRFMLAPLGPGPRDFFIRLHEMGHAAWTPPRVRVAIDRDCVNVVEDARIHLLLQREIGADLSDGGCTEGEREAMRGRVLGGRASLRWLALALVASDGTGDGTALRAAVAEAMEGGTTAGTGAGTGAAGAPTVAELAVRLSDVALGLLKDSQLDFAATTQVAHWLEAQLAAYDSAAKGAPRSHRRPSAGQRLPSGEAIAVPQVPWGRLSIERPGLALRLPGHLVGARWRPVEGGVIFRPHRWTSDRAVFGRRRRPAGGTVLVDGSGSMSLTTAELLALVARVPAATVAIYSATPREGVLRILARGGRRVPDRLVRAPSGHCNVVDGPALEWLAGQPGPRVWVSDGGVTGVGDDAREGNELECALICHAASIARVDDIQEAGRRLGRS